MSDGLELLSQAERMLAQVADARDAVRIKDYAEAARVYARKAGLGTSAINHATSIKVRAELRVADYVDKGQAEGQIAVAGAGNRRTSFPGETMFDIGLTRKAVHEARLLRDRFTDEQILKARAEADKRKQELTRAELLRKAQAYRRETTPAADPAAIEIDPGAGDWVSGDGRARFLSGDFRDRLEEIPGGSVDLIVTDPPYPAESLPLWSDLAKTAAELLGPRGILFAWTGQLALPEVLERLGEHLHCGWTFALHMPGSNSRIMGRHIIQAWKPVLAFTVGPWPSGEWGDDLLISPEADKGSYRWQQNAEPAKRVIERYCPPEGLVIDPFLGVGTFALAARDTGRRFIGTDLDAGRLATAIERVAR